jgi:hypothetical protein
MRPRPLSSEVRAFVPLRTIAVPTLEHGNHSPMVGAIGKIENVMDDKVRVCCPTRIVHGPLPSIP